MVYKKLELIRFSSMYRLSGQIRNQMNMRIQTLENDVGKLHQLEVSKSIVVIKTSRKNCKTSFLPCKGTGSNKESTNNFDPTKTFDALSV